MNCLGFGYLVEAEPLYTRFVDTPVGKTFVFAINKIGYDNICDLSEIKKLGVDVGTIVRFTIDNRNRVTRVYPLVFRK